MAASQSQTYRDIIQSGQGNNLTINQTIVISASEIKRRDFIEAPPYLGLKSFEEHDRAFFFGRESLIAQLLRDVAGSNFVMVAGPSGSGKSSLVSAGLLPQLRERLRKDLFRSFTFTPFDNPFTQLCCALPARYRRQAEQVGQDSETLCRIASSVRPGSELWLLFIDQFEELFTQCTDAALRSSFVEGLARLAGSAQQEVKLVLALRADFFDRLGSHPGLATLVERNLRLVKDMQAGELRAAIEQPAALHGVVLEEGLAERIVSEVKGQPAALPLLQHMLHRLWLHDVPHLDRTLKVGSYLALSGVLGALETHADELLNGRSAEQRDLMRRTLLRMVSLTASASGVRATRRRVRRKEFRSPEEHQLLDELIEAKLLVGGSADPERVQSEPTVEIAHEALLSEWGTLADWLSQAHEVLYLQGRLAADAAHWEQAQKAVGTDRAEEELWRGSRLRQALDMRQRGDFDSVLGGLQPPESAFLDASLSLLERQTEQEIRRRNREASLELQLDTFRQSKLSLYVENGRQRLLEYDFAAALAWCVFHPS